MAVPRHTPAAIKKAVNASTNRRQALMRLGLRGAGGNYAMLNQAIVAYGIDTSHFTGQRWAKGAKLPRRRETAEYLAVGTSVSSQKLKSRLIADGIFERKCHDCGGILWRGQPIPLELDHIDGIREDNRLENLRLLCPNCHALTPTYRGRNSRRQYAHLSPAAPTRPAARPEKCTVCAAPSVNKYCSCACYSRGQRKAERPGAEELARMVETMSLCAIGRQYGVSDNAVRKWPKAYGLR